MSIISNLLTEHKLVSAQKRRKEIRKFLDYYSGTSTSQYIKGFFDGEAFGEVPPYESNFTRKFINKISRIYTLGANRSLGSESLNKKYEEIIENKNVRMKHSERMTRLLGTIANRVLWKEDKSQFDYRPIYYFECYFDEDPFMPSAIIYPLMNKVYDLSATGDSQYAYWDKEKYAIINEDGSMIKEQANPYGILPFVFTHREDQLDEFLVEGASDIINCNEQVNIALTEMQLGMRFNLFGQPWVRGVDSDQNLMRAGSNVILDMGEDGAFNIASPQGNIEEAIKNIKFQIELVATNNHLWIQWSEEGGEVPSGISLMVKDMERKEDYFDDIALWRMYEKDFYEIERVIAEYNGISLPSSDKFRVDFEETEYPKTVQDQISKDTFDLEHNLTTEAKIMVRDNKDLTIEEAQKTIDDNKEVNKSEEPEIVLPSEPEEVD
jgi:hypothetical protein